MRHEHLLAAAVAAVVGCGGGMKKNARNAAVTEYNDLYKCPRGDVKTELLRELPRGDGVLYAADIRASGCGKTEDFNCEYMTDNTSPSGAKWWCISKTLTTKTPAPKGDPTDVKPGKGWYCLAVPDATDIPTTFCARTKESCDAHRYGPDKDKLPGCEPAPAATCYNRSYDGSRLLYCMVDAEECKRWSEKPDAASLCKTFD